MTGRDSKVVDLNAFKAERAARQLDLLESPAEPVVKTPEAARNLSDGDVAHRQRMLSHLIKTSAMRP